MVLGEKHGTNYLPYTMERRKIEIGERLRREREKSGYSQEAFAEILDCCAVTISRCW